MEQHHEESAAKDTNKEPPPLKANDPQLIESSVQDTPIKKQPITAEWLMTILTGIIAVLTAGNIIVYALLTKTTITQSQDALNASIEASHLDQRAWVGLASFVTIGGANTKDWKGFSYKTVRTIIRNSGKTPATNLSAVFLKITCDWKSKIGDYDAVTVEGKEKGKERSDKFSENEIRHHPELADRIREHNQQMRNLEFKEEKALFPDGQVLAPGVFMTSGISGENYENLSDGTPVNVYILGKITYNDVFRGTPLHTTKFCLRREADGTQFVSCPTGNSMD